MRTRTETTEFGPLEGSLMTLAGGREIAFFARDGAASVADFSDGAAMLVSAGEWFREHGRGIANAQRRGEVAIHSPIPTGVAARIERLARPRGESGRRPAPRWSRRLTAFGGRFLGAFTNAY